MCKISEEQQRLLSVDTQKLSRPSLVEVVVVVGGVIDPEHIR